MADEDVTLGELARRMDRFEKVIQASLKAIDDRMANHVVTRVEYDIKHADLEQRVVILERQGRTRANRSWALALALMAAMAQGVLALVVTLIH
jgi:hypothetical protein